MEEVAERISKLQIASLESGLDVTSDLVKTFNKLADGIEFSYSNEEFSEVDESVESLHPDPSKDSLIACIKKQNSLLKKDCSDKIDELRSTTNEFLNISKKNSLISEEFTYEKTNDPRDRANTLPDYPAKPLDLIYNELITIKSDLIEANKKIVESQDEILKQKCENFELKDQLYDLIEANNEFHARRICECLLF